MNSLVKINSIVGRQRLLIGFPREFGGSFMWRFYLVILNACLIGRCLLSTKHNSRPLKFVMKLNVFNCTIALYSRYLCGQKVREGGLGG